MTLTAGEREVVLTWNDQDQVWSLYSDSAQQRKAVLELAARIGVKVDKRSDSIQFTLPPGRGINFPGISQK